MELPELRGSPIRVYTLPKLTAHRGKLLSCHGHGIPVYAASFIRAREIVFETELLAEPRLLQLIAVHELFHFVWTRLSNSARHEFADLLRFELDSRARGELGESAVVKKSLLAAGPCSGESCLWRDYVCESFCDTAAWLYSGIELNPFFSLANRWKRKRAAWFEAAIGSGCNC